MSRNGIARPPSRYPTTSTASRTAASGSTPARATASRRLLRITTVARVRIGVLYRTQEQGEDEPRCEAAHVGEEGDPSADRPDVEKGVEGLQRDPVPDKDVGRQRKNKEREEEGKDARPGEIEDVGSQQAGDGPARPQHRDRRVRRDEDLQQATGDPGREIDDQEFQLAELVFH